MNAVIKTIVWLSIVILLTAPPLLFYGYKLSPVSLQLHKPMNSEEGLMLSGYDAVSYINEGKAIKGNPNLGLKWNEQIWYFTSEVNRLSFKTFPEKYTPQYGGYCANTMAKGFVLDANPEVWHVEDNLLFVFMNDSAKTNFISNIDSKIIKQANNKWSNN